MSSKLQHIVLNLEITPPQGNWQAIAARLDEEYDSTETHIAGKLTDWEATPPAAAWSNVMAGLAENEPATQKRSATIISFRKVAVAAAITGLLVFAAWYFFTGPSPKNELANQDAATAPGTQHQPVTKSATIPVAPIPELPERPLPRVKRQLAQQLFQPGNRRPESNYQFAAASYIPHTGVNDIRAIPVTRAPNVAAPLIRDAAGNIILDESLITSADNNYIIVTAPNGEQTRISSRFLKMLGSMNADVKPSDYFDYFFLGENNSTWKIRFSEWRNKLMQQASFIPTATNFLDILELKDMLQDN